MAWSHISSWLPLLLTLPALLTSSVHARQHRDSHIPMLATSASLHTDHNSWTLPPEDSWLEEDWQSALAAAEPAEADDRDSKLLGWMTRRHLQAPDDSDEAPKPEITKRTSLPGCEPAVSDAALEPLYRDNMFEDLKVYQEGEPLGHNALLSTIEFLSGELRKEHPHSKNWLQYMAVIVFWKGKGYAITSSKARKQVGNRCNGLVSNLENMDISIPDTLFLYNSDDRAVCVPALLHHPQACPWPVFSMFKPWSRKGIRYEDLLLPHFNGHHANELMETPWESKIPKALMRASLYAGMPQNCTRLQLYNMVTKDPAASKWLDVGITASTIGGLKIKKAKFLPWSEHVHYRYLLTADGFTASARFWKLMAFNSVVLKDPSHYIEFFYRSVHPGVHYVPYDAANITKVVQQLEQDQEAAQEIVRNAQCFMLRYLGDMSRAKWVLRLVREYNKLVQPGVMSQLLDLVPWDKVKQGKLDLLDFLDMVKEGLKIAEQEEQ